MRKTILIRGCCLALFVTAGGLAVAGQEPPASSPQPPATGPTTTPGNQPAGAVSGKPQRVLLRVNRNLEVRGLLELEDENVIVVRDLQGHLQNFAKARVEIIRLTEPEPGQTGIVRMMDGQIRRGIIVEDAFDHVIVEIEGIRANLKRSTVDYVELSPTVDQMYAEYKKTLEPNNYDARLMLCTWLYEKGRYELAKDETLALLELVEMAEARQLLNLLNAQLALKVAPAPAADPNGVDAPAGDADQPGANNDLDPRRGPVRQTDILPDQILTEDDVNVIRVYEIDFDHPPRVTITPDTIRTMIEKYGTNSLIPANQTGRNALFRTAADQPLQIVRLMFEMRARDLYPQVQVNSEPYALNLFRRRVHDTWLINTCATNACHGGVQAGRFFLHREDYKDERVRFTNMLILERLQLDPQWPLINWDKPEDSLIIQYAMPRNQARKPHPLVDGWKSAFSQSNARMKDEAIEWIGSMMQPRSPYPVDFEPPKIGLPSETPPVAPETPAGRVPR